MNVFLHELKFYRKSTIVWSISMAALIIFFLSMYPSFSSSASLVKKVLEGYPEPIRKAFGISIDDITKFLGFYSYVFSFVVLGGAIQSMNYGISTISKEIKLKTADFLMTKPIPRNEILTFKLLASLTSIVITDIIYLVTAYITAESVTKESFDIRLFFMISVTLFFVEIIFMSIGVLISAVVGKIKSTISLSLGVVFTFYIIGMLQATLNDKAMKYITPFKYFDTEYIIKNSSYDITFVIISILIVLISIFLSYAVFLKRDIHAV
ncbi:ABC transporter permease [Thermoanaerobacterium thermosaccharolyticum]|uniref:ABC transporter permease n=1 Tax=Thermoanaerobacterium thermosaccharolyticum TaxID=1517 RepID=A0A223HXD0_THETR|nr:ABC transporter permease subunit [Thermoanaerobacterium thermosaccharolyticum]AST57136.1 ABC transporter permease [Thermoanaerobacterium thermosaccharolyticum]